MSWRPYMCWGRRQFRIGVRKKLPTPPFWRYRFIAIEVQ